MVDRTRIIISLQRQIVFGVAYIYGHIWIGLPLFNISIDCEKREMDFFRFSNLWNK